MSASSLLNQNTGTILPQYLPVARIEPLGENVIFQQPVGVISAPLTGTIDIPIAGDYFVQLYLDASSPGSVGTSGNLLLTNSSGSGWNDIAVPFSSIPLNAPFTQLALGFFPAGTASFSLTLPNGFDGGNTHSSEISVRVLQLISKP